MVARMKTSGRKCCAGCSSTTTSSPAISPPGASSSRSSATAPDPVIEKFLRSRVDNAFGILERHLANREYVVGAQPTIADMSLAGYMYYPAEESGYDLPKQFPAIARWSGQLKKLPGWKPPYELLPGERVTPRW
jgi:glutathione S-transferase